MYRGRRNKGDKHMNIINKHKINMEAKFEINNCQDGRFSLLAKVKYSFSYEGLIYEINHTVNICQNVTLDEIDKAFNEGRFELILQNEGYNLVKKEIQNTTFRKNHLIRKLSQKNFNYTYEVDEEKETMTVVEGGL